MAGARRRPLLALVVALLAGALAFLASTDLATAGPVLCGEPPLQPCEEPPTTIPATTTTVEEPTTSAAPPTTAAPSQTTSTTVRRATTTTERQVVATTTTTLQVTTSLNLLVPGDGTEGAESTTTTIQTASRVSSTGTSDGTLIAVIVGGLIALAVFVSVLTWRYWVATRPPLVPTVGSDHG